MTTNWPHLTKAPIVEGLIDIRVERSSALTLDALKAACDELAADFPSREVLSKYTGQFSFSPESGTSFSAQAPAPVGVMLKSTDQKWVAQFRLDGFTLSRLKPYTSWDELRARAMELWGKYNVVAQPMKIVRLACRFINRIPLPPGKSFEKTFMTTFSIPASLPQAVAGYLLRVVIPFEKEQCLAIVTETLQENSHDCIFDLDAFSETPEGTSETDAWVKLDQLRGVKNRLFFEGLTPEALKEFE